MADFHDLIIGSQAPEFSLPTSDGSEIAFVDFRFKRKVYLFFVREFI